MARHEARTGLPYDRVMVFPQGVFSEAGVDAIKRAGFLAAVNSEVISADDKADRVRVCDYWNVAVMNYCDFPVFTRRHPSEGIENFAFDILLGKPCLVVVHQGDFHGEGRQIEGFITQLRRLHAPLRWMTLADAVRSSVRQRRISPDEIEVETYAAESRLENSSGHRVTFRMSKREAAPETVAGVDIGAQPAEWAASDGRVAFQAELNPGELRQVVVRFNTPAAPPRVARGLGARVKVAARRYLSEARDNYLMPKSAW